jgi:hypothetical protein
MAAIAGFFYAHQIAKTDQRIHFVYFLSSIRRSQPVLTCYYLVRRSTRRTGGSHMKRSAIAALGAAVIAMLGASSATHAAAVNFDFSAFDSSIIHDGTSLSDSTSLDLNDALELVTSVVSGEASGLQEGEAITLTGATSPTLNNAIIYGSAPGPLGANVVLSWPMVALPGVDTFTETLTMVTTIVTDPSDPDFIGVTLTGTLTDSMGLFMNAPVVLTFTAT